MTRIAGLLTVLILMPFCAATPGAAQDYFAGKKLVQEHCARCHAMDEDGESPNKEAPPFRVVVKRYPITNIAEALVEGIVVGHEAMPQFKFTAKEVTDLLAFLDSLSGDPG